LAAAGVVGAAVCLAVVALGVSAALIARERAEAVRQRDAAQRERDEAQRQRETARRAVDEMYAQVAEKWLGEQPERTAVQGGVPGEGPGILRAVRRRARGRPEGGPGRRPCEETGRKYPGDAG